MDSFKLIKFILFKPNIFSLSVVIAATFQYVVKVNEKRKKCEKMNLTRGYFRAMILKAHYIRSKKELLQLVQPI